MRQFMWFALAFLELTAACTPEPIIRDAVVFVGHAAFSFHAPKLLRLQYDEHSLFPTQPSVTFIKSHETASHIFNMTMNSTTVTLTTSALTVNYHCGNDFRNPGALQVQTVDNTIWRTIPSPT